MVRTALAVLLVFLALLAPREAEAQLQTAFGAGVSVPVGDFSDTFDRGFTARGQVGLSLVLASVHAQLGWSRFALADGLQTSGLDDADVWHAGVGGRLGLGLFFVGANAAYFFGDGENEAGIMPEVGLSLLNFEVVADGRVTGDAKWLGLRAGVRF